jgi:hypothetical protein
MSLDPTDNSTSGDDSNADKPHLSCYCVVLKPAPYKMVCGAEVARPKALPRNPDHWCHRCADIDTKRPVLCKDCGATVRS